LPHNISVSVNYLNTRGSHILQTYNINSPFPGTYIPALNGLPAQGLYPYGQAGGIQDLYSGSGVYRQNQLVVNSNARINTRFSLFGYYAYGHVKTDVNGSPSNPYNFATDYGRASYDVRHRANINGSIVAPWGIRLSPNIGMSSAPPFNIVQGIDTNGDSVINDRPAFIPAGSNIATCTGNVKAGAAPCISHGYVLNPTPGMTIIPVNYGVAHSQVNVNMRISRTWGFGERTLTARQRQQQQDGGGGRGPGFGQAAGGGGGGPRGGGGPGGGGGGARGGGGPGGGGDAGGSSGRKYSLTASMMFHNMFNTVNQGPPVGSLNSPLFGQSLSLAGGGGFGPGGGAAQAFNRRIDFSLRFSF
jgi:hypothetical protein